MIRHAWIGDGSGERQEDARVDDATLEDFAHDATVTLLKTEPRLATIATLIERAGPLDEQTWREVGGLVGTFLGPASSAARLVPRTNESQQVAPLLAGEVTRRRFMAALRDLTGQA